MAKNYLGYTDRDKNSFVDWGKIGSDLSQTLISERDEREQRKQDLENQTQESIKALRDSPVGEYKPANEFSLNLANSAQQELLMVNKLMKSGLLKPQDYTRVRQNLTSDTKTIYEAMEEYQTKYAESMERAKTGINSETELKNWESLEGLADLNTSTTYIDPVTGRISVAKIDKDGNMIKTPGSYLTPNQIKVRMNMKFDKFNLNENLQAEAERIAKFKTANKVYGKITEISDPTLRKQYENFEKNIISGMIDNDYSLASILVDHLTDSEGNPYESVFNPEEAKKNPNAVLWTDNGSGRLVPQITDDQRKRAEEAIKDNLRNMIDREEDIKAVTEPRDYSSRGRGKGQPKDSDSISNLGKLYYGTPQEVQAAESFFQGINPDIVKIDRTDRDLIVTDNEGNRKTISFYAPDGVTQLTLPQFIESAVTQLTKVEDLGTALQQAGLDLNKEFNPSGVASFAVEAPEYEGFDEAYRRQIRSVVPDNLFVIDDETKTKENLTNFINAIPGLKNMTVTEVSPGSDEVAIRQDGKEVLRFNVDEGVTQEQMNQYIDQIVDYASGRLTAEEKVELVIPEQKNSAEVDYSNL